MEDPKKKAGALKDPLHLLPTVALRKLSHVLALGAEKYGEYNWRESEGVGTSTYSAAIMRHLLQFMDGEDIDEESRQSHLVHIMATCAILLDAEQVGKLVDDRIKTSVETRIWKPQCGEECSFNCKNSITPIVCKSCVLPDGQVVWTNFDPLDCEVY